MVARPAPRTTIVKLTDDERLQAIESAVRGGQG